MESIPKPYEFQPLRRRRVRMTRAADVASAGTHSATDGRDDNTEGDCRLNTLGWCICGMCEIMATVKECLCCKELSALNTHFDQLERVHVLSRCITNHDDFNVLCLNRAVLRTTYIMQRHVRGDDSRLPEQLENRKYRYIAYKTFTAWTHGQLGKRNRCVIPACAVTDIRRMFPEEDGNYTGFQDVSEVRDALQFD